MLTKMLGDKLMTVSMTPWIILFILPLSLNKFLQRLALVFQSWYLHWCQQIKQNNHPHVCHMFNKSISPSSWAYRKTLFTHTCYRWVGSYDSVLTNRKQGEVMHSTSWHDSQNLPAKLSTLISSCGNLRDLMLKMEMSPDSCEGPWS